LIARSFIVVIEYQQSGGMRDLDCQEQRRVSVRRPLDTFGTNGQQQCPSGTSVAIDPTRRQPRPPGRLRTFRERRPPSPLVHTVGSAQRRAAVGGRIAETGRPQCRWAAFTASSGQALRRDKAQVRPSWS
jgi:hypothetical protein